MSEKEPYHLNQVSIRMVHEPPLYSKEPVNNPEAAVRLVSDLLRDLDREVMCVVNLRNDLKPINVNIVSVGTVNSSIVHPREILKSAILSNASSVMLFHNHPSGNLQPSPEDIELTDRMAKAGEILGIPITDHIIVGTDHQYFSFRNNRIMPVPQVQYAEDIHKIHWKGMTTSEASLPYQTAKGKGEMIIQGKRISYDDLLRNVSVEILPFARMQNEFHDIPYQRIEDLAVMYRAFEKPVTIHDLKDLGISTEQFHKDAIQAAAINHPYQIIPIDEAIGLPSNFMKSPYYVATNDILDHGASVIAYPAFLENAEKAAGDEFYVLPSSIHEVIIFPVSAGLGPEKLNKIVRGANAACVAEQDQLSDHVYRYDSRTKELKSCMDSVHVEKQIDPDLQKYVKDELKDDLDHNQLTEDEYRYLSRNVEKMSASMTDNKDGSLHDRYQMVKTAMLIGAGFINDDSLEDSLQMNAVDFSGPFSM